MTQTAKQNVSPINLHEKAPHFHNSLSEQSCTERAPKGRSGALSWMCTGKQGTGWTAAGMVFKPSLPVRLLALHCTLSCIAFTCFLTWRWQITGCNELAFLHNIPASPLASLGWEGGISLHGSLVWEQRQHMKIRDREQQRGAALDEHSGSDYCSRICSQMLEKEDKKFPTCQYFAKDPSDRVYLCCRRWCPVLTMGARGGKDKGREREGTRLQSAVESLIHNIKSATADN